MDEFKRYCLDNQGDKLNFMVSGPPEPVFLLLKSKVDKDLREKSQLAFMILIHDGAEYNQQRNMMENIYKKLINYKIKVVTIKYDKDFESLVIDHNKYPIDEAGVKLSEVLNMPIRDTPQKPANDKGQVTDLFHLWSSNLFDGCCVVKIDLDVVAFNASNYPRAIIEIKRSTKTKLGDWYPYDNDLTGFMLQIDFANKLGIDFITIEHDCYPERNKKKMTDNTNVNMFKISNSYKFKGRQISDLILSKKQMKVKDVLNELI